MRLLFFYAFLALGLLLDGAYLFRLTLACCALHEAAHSIVYILCARTLPRLRCSAGGLRMEQTARLSRCAQLLVLCAGPAANFALTASLLLAAHQKASYSAYFLAAVSLCVGLYNLLPLGALDGAQIAALLLPATWQGTLFRVRRALLVLLCGVTGLWALLGAAPVSVRILALTGPVYLVLEDAFG